MALARAGMSLEPCHGMCRNSWPSGPSRAGKKRVKPNLCRKGAAKRAESSGSKGSGSPARISIAGLANNWKVISDDAGLPGSPKTGLPRHVPNAVGCPGCTRTRSK